MFFPWIPLTVLGFRALSRVLKEVDKNKTPAAKPAPKKPGDSLSQSGVKRSKPSPRVAPPKPFITLVGRTSAGKSSLANALLGQETFVTGVEHGTTSNIQSVPFGATYQLQDTPGLLDGETYRRGVLNAAKASELVILITTGQLYRQELDFLRDLGTVQRMWNDLRGSQPARSTMVFINQDDLKEHTMPSDVRAGELSALRQQVQDWVSEDRVLVGAAAPYDGKSRRIDSLKAHLEKFLSHAAA